MVQADGAAQAVVQAEVTAQAADQTKKKKEPVATIVLDDLNTASLGGTVLQGSITKVKLIYLAKMREGRQRYREREGADPEKEEAPTREQASAFLALLEERESVSVDFAIFGPHGDRLMKMRKFDTMAHGARW